MSDLRGRLADTWMLSAAPGWPSHLPWPLAYACYRALARQRSLYSDFASGAACAPEYVPIADVDAFMRDVRTVHLLDVAGAWPKDGAFVVVTFHYGTGLWLCRALRRAGHRGMFLSGRFERDAFEARPLLHRYGMERLAEVERITGAPIAYRPGARETLLDALANGISVIGLIDVPPRLAPRGQRPVDLLGRPASLPDGLLQLATDAAVPIVPCWVELDFASGCRRVVIGEALAPAPSDATLAALAATLDGLIRRSPAQWMFWREWPGWIEDAAPLRANQ